MAKTVISFRVMDDIYLLCDPEGKIQVIEGEPMVVVQYLHDVYTRLSKYELWLRYDKYLPRAHGINDINELLTYSVINPDMEIEVHRLGDIHGLKCTGLNATEWHEAGESPDLLAIAYNNAPNNNEERGND